MRRAAPDSPSSSSAVSSAAIPLSGGASVLMEPVASASKDVDDPTAPLRTDSPFDGEYIDVSLLQNMSTQQQSMISAGQPSYSEATGPLHLRGMLTSGASIPLPDHLYQRGFVEGRHSDITVIAFDTKYNLHRLILDRAPFFTALLSEPWRESQSREIAVHPDKIDSNITQGAFELAVKKLYGHDISSEADAEAVGLFAAGCWLEMQDLIQTATESILRQMTPQSLSPLIRLMTANYYGRAGGRILESAKAMLSRCGWEMPLRYWDGMPAEVIRELVASDGFFVYNEWDRWVLSKRLLDRRLRQVALEIGLVESRKSPLPKAPGALRLMALRFDGVYRQNEMTLGQGVADHDAPWFGLYTHPDIEPLLVLLDEGIHYIHMEFEQLNFLKSARDVFGLPVLPEKVISSALWQQLALRQRVMMAEESSQVLGLSKTPPAPVPEPQTPSTEIQSLSSVDDDGFEADMEAGSWDGNGKPRKFWIPSSDCNIVLGNGTDPIVTASNTFQRHASRLSATIQPEDAQWATDFGSSPFTMANPNTIIDQPGRPMSVGGSNAGQPKPIAYTEFPPFRFSTEFPNPRSLKEKKRVKSRTVFYAGSLWNIYIQKVPTSKSVQLGVYLQRAKQRDVEEQGPGLYLSQQAAGSVDQRIGQLERNMWQQQHRRAALVSSSADGDLSLSGSEGDGDGILSLSPPPRSRHRHPAHPNASDPSAEPLSSVEKCAVSSTDSESDDPASSYPDPMLSQVGSKRRSALPPYVDRRPTIKTYFKIYSPSKGGRVLSVYESAPDRFNFSQSWGWKSSTLMLDEKDNSGGAGADREKEGSGGTLRFMVVIGNL
ncbi:hypothetical protein M011DRAFT_413806 [Sporormia fimetaria CBS 119925]|uniref:BTB domain-containing protein n=1 Tax=Sporormia fimetaria CBS 119925 TaxID=1340428 RepID=A0A6A6UWD6_9PLEO|nr:hypothetical protein M011DRAFT_413806 [Sporormia fimetaria CBS 119925]